MGGEERRGGEWGDDKKNEEKGELKRFGSIDILPLATN